MVDRVFVSHPRRRSARARPRTATAEIDAQTRLGEVYMRSLLRTQLRLSLTIGGASLGLLALLPMVFWLVPATRRAELLGIPVPWLLLGVVVYPLLVGTAWFYVRHAERAERDFIELMGRR